MLKVTPMGAEPCQSSRHLRQNRMGVGFILLLSFGCGTAEKRPEKKRDEEPEPKPIETRRLYLGEPRIHREHHDSRPPLPGMVEIRTWADEIIRGQLVAEDASSYLIAPPDATPRRVHRSAVMSIGPLDRR